MKENIVKIFLIGDPFLCCKIIAAFPKNCLPQKHVFSGIFSDKKSHNSSKPIICPTKIEEYLNDPLACFINLSKKKISIPPEKLITLVHPSAIYFEDLDINHGCVIFPHCVFYQNVKIGSSCVFMNHSKISHDVNIGDNCFFDYYSFVGSYNVIQENVVISSKASVKENVIVEKNSIIMPFSVVIQNVPENQIWGGAPAKQLTK